MGRRVGGGDAALRPGGSFQLVFPLVLALRAGQRWGDVFVMVLDLFGAALLCWMENVQSAVAVWHGAGPGEAVGVVGLCRRGIRLGPHCLCRRRRIRRFGWGIHHSIGDPRRCRLPECFFRIVASLYRCWLLCRPPVLFSCYWFVCGLAVGCYSPGRVLGGGWLVFHRTSGVSL